MGNLGTIKVHMMNVRIAGKPTFMPAADPKRHHTMVTVICNRGVNPTNQQPMSDEVTLNFWGPYALTAAKYLDTGREINVEGELRSFRHQTGQVGANGKPVIERRVEVQVQKFFFGKDSLKELTARINARIAELKAGGRIPQQVILDAGELLTVNRPDPGDYNPAIHDATGTYGNARIWRKGVGFVGQGAAAAAPLNTGTAGDIASLTEQMRQIQAQLSAAQNAGATAGAGPVNPFEGV